MLTDFQNFCGFYYNFGMQKDDHIFKWMIKIKVKGQFPKDGVRREGLIYHRYENGS